MAARPALAVPQSGVVTLDAYRASHGLPVKAAARSGPGAAVRALGRLPAGELNKTERRYADFLVAETAAGRVLWHKFEIVKIRLAAATFFTPDFVVMLADRSLEFVDVKGARAIFEEDARVKIKCAAAAFEPVQFVAVYPRPAKDGGGWERETF